MLKWEYNGRWFKRRGFCTIFKIAGSNIFLSKADVWFIPECKVENYKWWEENKAFSDFKPAFDYFEEHKNDWNNLF